MVIYNLPGANLFKKYKEIKILLNRLSEREKVRHIERMIKENTDLHENLTVLNFLFDYYNINPEKDENIYRIDNKPYHIYVKPEWRFRKNTDSVLDPLLSDNHYKLDARYQETHNQYLNHLKLYGRRIIDRQTFRLIDINTEDKNFVMKCGIGKYFSYLSTCEILADDLLDSLRLSKIDFTQQGSYEEKKKLHVNSINSIKNKMQLRDYFAPNIEKLTDYDLRDLKIGLNVFSVFNTNEGPLCYLPHRGPNLGEYPNIYHVIPAGTFQHDSEVDLDYETLIQAYDIKYKVLGEFWEEMIEGANEIKKQQIAKTGARINLSEMTTNDGKLKPIEELQKHLGGSHGAYLYVTGFGIDLLSAKPELLLLLVVDDASYHSKYGPYFKRNWELKDASKIEEGQKRIYNVYLRQTDKIKDIIKPGYMIPAGAVAVDRGMRVLAELKKEHRINFDIPDW